MGVEDQILRGGNTTPVVRRGDVVHRQAGSWTPAVHRLLSHLRSAGVDAVPRPHGLDGCGREIVDFLPGVVPADPMPDWVWRDEVLVDAARLLARVHAATAGYLDDEAVWRSPVREPQEVICHNDFAPYNLVFNEARRLTGVIDWDFASPGPRVWDVAYLAYRLVPLSAPDNPDLPWTSIRERRRRVGLLCEAYGGDILPAAVTATAVSFLAFLISFTSKRALGGASHVAAHVEIYERDRSWLADHLGELGQTGGTTDAVATS